MENLSLRPKGDFTWTAEYRELYILTEHWLSDLQFHKHDLHFLYHLIDKYFIWLTNEESLGEMRNLSSGLSETNTNCDKLLEKTSKHLNHLAELIDDPFKYDSHKFRSEHEELENEIASFIKKFRKIKKETFADIEPVIEKEVKRLAP
jgi:phosphomevalonate kinase